MVWLPGTVESKNHFAQCRVLSTTQIVFTRQSQSLALYILPSTTVVMWWREMAPEGGIRGLLARDLRCAILPLPVSVSVPLLRLSGHLSILLSNCPCKNFQAGQNLSSVCYHHLQVSPLTLDHIQSGHWSSLVIKLSMPKFGGLSQRATLQTVNISSFTSFTLHCSAGNSNLVTFLGVEGEKAKGSYLRDRNI